MNHLTKNIAILGHGKNWMSLVNFLDRNTVCKNGIWTWQGGPVAKKFGLNVVKKTFKEKGTDVGLLFFEYPDESVQQYMTELKNNNIQYILMWPWLEKFHTIPTSQTDFLATNIFLSCRPVWNDILNRI
jgi:hypothetical protein